MLRKTRHFAFLTLTIQTIFLNAPFNLRSEQEINSSEVVLNTLIEHCWSKSKPEELLQNPLGRCATNLLPDDGPYLTTPGGEIQLLTINCEGSSKSYSLEGCFFEEIPHSSQIFEETRITPAVFKPVVEYIYERLTELGKSDEQLAEVDPRLRSTILIKSHFDELKEEISSKFTEFEFRDLPAGLMITDGRQSYVLPELHIFFSKKEKVDQIRIGFSRVLFFFDPASNFSRKVYYDDILTLLGRKLSEELQRGILPDLNITNFLRSVSQLTLTELGQDPVNFGRDLLNKILNEEINPAVHNRAVVRNPRATKRDSLRNVSRSERLKTASVKTQRGLVSNLPAFTGAVKLYLHELNPNTRESIRTKGFRFLGGLLQRIGYGVLTVDFMEPLPVYHRLFDRRISEEEFYGLNHDLAIKLGLVRLMPILMSRGHGGNCFDRPNEPSDQPLLEFLVLRAPKNVDIQYVGCMAANYVHYHLTGYKRFQNFNALKDHCERNRSPVYRISNKFFVNMNEGGITFWVGLEYLQGRGKALWIGTSCNAKVPSDSFDHTYEIFKRPTIPFSSFSYINSVDLLYAVCRYSYGQDQLGLWLCPVTNAMYIDFLPAKDLFGVSYFRGETQSAGEFMLDANGIMSFVEDPLSVWSCTRRNIQNFVKHFARYSINTRKVFNGDRLSRRNFLEEGCPERNDPPHGGQRFYQTYAISGLGTHQDFLRGYANDSLGRQINYPVPGFLTHPLFNFNLRSGQESIAYRESYRAIQFTTTRVGSPQRILAPIPFSYSMNLFVPTTVLPNAFNPITHRQNRENFLARHAHIVDRGLDDRATTLASTVKNVVIDEDRNDIYIHFTIPSLQYFNTVKSKIILSKGMNVSPYYSGVDRQSFDFSPYVLRSRPESSGAGSVLKLSFHPDAVEILSRQTWFKSFEDFQKTFKKSMPQSAKTQFDWPYYMEIHLYFSDGGYFDTFRFAGNATETLANNSLTQKHLFWSWPLAEVDDVGSSNPSDEFKELSALRSAPYMISLGMLFDPDRLIPSFIYKPNYQLLTDAERQNVFVLRVPLKPKPLFCKLRVKRGCKILRRAASNRLLSEFFKSDFDDGRANDNDGEPCEVKICGDLPDESVCESESFDEDINDPENRNVVDMCELGGATCCPNVSSAACGEQLECETRSEFESEEELEEFKNSCESQGGTFYKHCEFKGWEKMCCERTPGICEPSTSEGCCNATLSNDGEQCSGETQSAQYVEVGSDGRIKVTKCPGVDRECYDATPTPTRTATPTHSPTSPQRTPTKTPFPIGPLGCDIFCNSLPPEWKDEIDWCKNGSKGNKGSSGGNGSTGITGSDGETGLTGSFGAFGSLGTTGIKITPRPTATLTSTTTHTPTTTFTATATITNTPTTTSTPEDPKNTGPTPTPVEQIIKN